MIRENVMVRCAMLIALLIALATPADAQLGRLKKRVQQGAGDKAPPNKPASAALAGMARVTAVIDWTVETSTVPSEWAGDMSWTGNMRRTSGLPDSPLGPNTYTPATTVDVERGSVTLQMDFDPNDLPGGTQSRLMGGRLGLGWAQGQPIQSGSRLVSLAGSVSLDRTIRPIGTCQRNAAVGNSMPIDPPSATMSGRRDYNATDTDIGVNFMGEKPVSLNVGRGGTGDGARGVPVSGRGSYACGGAFVPRDTENLAGVSLMVMEGTHWATQVQPTNTGYVLTGRAEEKERGWRVVRIVTLTWTAPSAPQAQQAGSSAPNLADQMKFEDGKGSITVTQQGKQATWLLQSMSAANQAGVKSTTMMFTPEGGLPSEDRGVIALAITNVMGQTMVGLNVAKGPGGDVEFEADECSALLKPAAGKSMSGSGECRRGSVIVKFTFTSAKQAP